MKIIHKVDKYDVHEYVIEGSIYHHCETGPAIFYKSQDGVLLLMRWFLKGREFSETDWKKEIRKLKLDKILK